MVPCKACVGIKMAATDPSSALHNATEIAKVLISKYGSKETVPPLPPLSFCTWMVDPNTAQHF